MPFKLVPMVAAAFVTAFMAIAAEAAERLPYDSARFVAAQDAGKPILIDISASWCPTCKQQKPIIDSLIQQPAYAGLSVFDVNFDNQKDVVRWFGATSQSTLIALRGKSEKARSVGDTNPTSIGSLIAATLTPDPRR